MQAVDHVIEQLWRPALEQSDALRVVIDPPPSAGWRTVESYWLVPRAATARLLVPIGPRRITRRSLTNYRRLRTRGTNLARVALGTAATMGLPLSRSRVEIQARVDAADRVVDLLPVPQLRKALGLDLFASTGVRTSDNRKTMLHLVDCAGRPVGYAKFGWNRPSDALVATEAEVLSELGRSRDEQHSMRAPALLARLEYHGHTVAVTAPLPQDIRGSAGTEPSAQELFSLTPVQRRAPIAETAQFAAVINRLKDAASSAHVGTLAERSLAAAALVAEHPARLPVTSWWHGDFAPWNAARDGSGQLWVWDWENAERDAVGGLDALHWTFSSQRLRARDLSMLSLADALTRAEHYLVALGLDPLDRRVVAAHYAVVVVERACTLAQHAGTWAESLIGPPGLSNLLDQAKALLDRSHDAGPTTLRTS